MTEEDRLFITSQVTRLIGAISGIALVFIATGMTIALVMGHR